MPPVVDDYCASVARYVHDCVGEELVGVWAFGSVALGDYVQGRSDVDIQAVSEGVLPVAQRRELATALSHDALPCPARGLEFVLYSREGLRDPAGPAFQLNLNTGAEMAQHVALDADADPRFWFVVDVAIGREHGRPLLGPPPAEVFPALPDALVVDSLAQALEWYAASGQAAEATIGTAQRALAYVIDGVWLSKSAAAAWAAARQS